jgi:hypothetical protein
MASKYCANQPSFREFSQQLSLLSQECSLLHICDLDAIRLLMHAYHVTDRMIPLYTVAQETWGSVFCVYSMAQKSVNRKVLSY